MNEIEIQNVIDSIRESFVGASHVYTHGACHGFYRIMKAIYSDAELWINEDLTHVAVYLAGELWDINGPISEGDFKDDNFHKANEEEAEMAESFGWDLYCQGWECPNCDGIHAYGEMRKAQAVSQRYVKQPDGTRIKEVRYFEPAETIKFGAEA